MEMLPFDRHPVPDNPAEPGPGSKPGRPRPPSPHLPGPV